MKKTKDRIENLLRHLIFHNISILSCLDASKNELRLKKLPLWVHDPVADMFVELMQDLQDALAPVLDIAEKEYQGRPDRLAVIKQAMERYELRKKSQSGFDGCHCAGCESNRNIALKKYPIKRRIREKKA